MLEEEQDHHPPRERRYRIVATEASVAALHHRVDGIAFKVRYSGKFITCTNNLNGFSRGS
ncbi:hypothetical protein C1N53_08745 [Pontibacter sp. SGAir0037]|nr:hypothetical protein C1N53_08745 [Pontibacter sp. SGAir0037]